jgi:hypothetical protein
MRRGKYTTRKGYRKYRKYHTRKNRKHIQKQKRLRRQTRNKRGGVFSIRPNHEITEILYRGYALVTKWGLFGPAIGAGKDRREQILIFISNSNNIFILRCVDDEKDDFKCGNAENVEIMGIDLRSLTSGRVSENEFFFKSLDNGEKYRIKLIHEKKEETDKQFIQSVSDFILKVRKEKQRVYELLRLSSSPGVSSKQAHGISGEKVKIKSIVLGKETLKDANALIGITGKTLDPEYPENIYSLVINGEDRIKFLLRRGNGFEYNNENDKVIDETCYRLYTFTDMDDESKSIQIYVPVSREEGSLFYILQLGQVGNEDDILNLCGQEY